MANLFAFNNSHTADAPAESTVAVDKGTVPAAIVPAVAVQIDIAAAGSGPVAACSHTAAAAVVDVVADTYLPHSAAVAAT